MAPIIHFKCRNCEKDLALPPLPSEHVRCPHCNSEIPFFMNDSILTRGVVTTCASCGHDDLYVQKDFNRQVGVGVVAIGILASIYLLAKDMPLRAMIALGLTALVDFVVYFFVGEVTVCYACHAIFRGFGKNPEHEPFDLKKLEKYGGRTPRGSA